MKINRNSTNVSIIAIKMIEAAITLLDNIGYDYIVVD